MPTKPPVTRLTIPVETLWIKRGPSQDDIIQASQADSADEGVKVKFTIVTEASEHPGTIKAIIYKLTPCRPDTDDSTTNPEYFFQAIIQGQRFSGRYRSHNRTGTLWSGDHDLDDPFDWRNWD